RSRTASGENGSTLTTRAGWEPAREFPKLWNPCHMAVSRFRPTASCYSKRRSRTDGPVHLQRSNPGVVRLSEGVVRIPVSTYHLPFNRDFRFKHVIGIAD